MSSKYGFSNEARGERRQPVVAQGANDGKSKEDAQLLYSEFFYRPDEDKQFRAVVNVSQPELYLRVLGDIPGLEIITGKNEDRVSVALTIVEGVRSRASAALPEGNVLVVNPADGLPIVGQIIRPVAIEPHHIMEAIDFRDIRDLLIHKARSLAPAPGLDVVVQSQFGPLLLAGEYHNRRIAILAFDLYDSNLPGMVIFPRLMTNLVNWLSWRDVKRDGSNGHELTANRIKERERIIAKAYDILADFQAATEIVFEFTGVRVDATVEPFMLHLMLEDAVWNKLDPAQREQLIRTLDTETGAKTEVTLKPYGGIELTPEAIFLRRPGETGI